MKRRRKKDDSASYHYLLFLKENIITYDPACLVLTIIAFVLFSFGMWYHDIFNVLIAIAFYLLCHIYAFILRKSKCER